MADFSIFPARLTSSSYGALLPAGEHCRFGFAIYEADGTTPAFPTGFSSDVAVGFITDGISIVKRGEGFVTALANSTTGGMKSFGVTVGGSENFSIWLKFADFSASGAPLERNVFRVPASGGDVIAWSKSVGVYSGTWGSFECSEPSVSFVGRTDGLYGDTSGIFFGNILRVPANDASDGSGAVRPRVMTVELRDGDAFEYLYIFQDGPESEPQITCSSGSTMSAGCYEGFVDTTVIYSQLDDPGEITASSADEWISFPSGVSLVKFYGLATVECLLAENRTGAERTGTISFSGALGGACTLTVTQAAILEAKLAVTPSTRARPAVGGYFPAARIDAENTTWTAKSSASWCVLSAASGGSGTTWLYATLSANTDFVARRSATVTVTADGGALVETFSVEQAAADSTAELPSGNGPSGGTEDAPSFSTGGGKVVFRGTAEPFEAESGVEGGVDESGGESWTVTLRMRRSRVPTFIRSAKLFLHSTWQPVALPSRNRPLICGWDVDYEGGVGTVKIRYQLKTDTEYSYSSSDDDGAPAEKVTRTGSNVCVERPLSENPHLFSDVSSAEAIAENAKMIAVLQQLVAIRMSALGTDTSAAEAALIASISDLGWTAERLEAHPAYPLLMLGQTSYLAWTSTFTVEETRNQKPSGVGDAVGTYSSPESALAKGPGKFWLLTEDAVNDLGNGQFTRRRTWQNAEIKSAAYGGVDMPPKES